MTEDLKQKGGDLAQTRSALESTKLDIAQKIAMIEQVTRDRDNERNLARQEREQQAQVLQDVRFKADRAQQEARRCRESLERVQRDLDQKNQQLDHIKYQMEEFGRNPVKLFGLF